MNCKVYLELSTTKIFIGILEHKGDLFYCDLFEEQLWGCFAIKDGVLYNPSMIGQFITQFLHANNLVGAWAVISCPYLSSCPEAKRDFAVLQVALCACKAGLRIESLGIYTC
jgi:hypothetical protein